MSAWPIENMPDLGGRIAIVTGATSGLGLWCARALAARGADVVLAVRNEEKGQRTAEAIRGEFPAAQLSVSALDLASLESVRDFAGRAGASLPRVDLLLNNAGLGLQPRRAVTQDGFEQQWGVNYLGHFALTGLLVPALLHAPAPRVVTVASMAHRRGKILWEDPNQTQGYSGRIAYNQSKLACLMFALELAARAGEQNSRLAGLAAHPGLALTGFIKATGLPGFKQAVGVLASTVIGQSAEAGSWPLLYAATMPDAANGDYWGPDGFLEIRGKPARGGVWPHARSRADWQRLWTMAEQATGVVFPPLG
jgi:NAD(P)-dependent dehydrogenase (short-subunit alcohol dehydrogenase family)